jgi:DNA-binding Xre family transcriptional regulator
MGMKYYKLFDLLNRKGMKKTDLLEILSSPTLAKLTKGESITTDILCKICSHLKLQPGDIMEFVEEGDS